MGQVMKWGVACLLAITLATGFFAVTVGQADGGMFKTQKIYAEEQKKQPEPGAKPAGDEDEGGCKC